MVLYGCVVFPGQSGEGYYTLLCRLCYRLHDGDVPNYFFTNWYTFNTRPTKKNAGGFLFSRAINIMVQFVLLPLALAAFPGWRDDIISMMVIFIGGCINYLICLVFFQKKRKK